MARATPLAAAYDDWHRGRAEDLGADAPWYRLVEQHVGQRALGADVLEVACGRGGFVPTLKRLGAQTVIAADLSEAALAIAAAHLGPEGLPGVTLDRQDVEALTYADNRFGVVVCCETIEHVRRPARAVREIARVLAPGGWLLLTAPNYLNLLGLHRLYRRVRGRGFSEEGQPINRLTFLPRTCAWVRRAGLGIQAIEGQGHYVPVARRTAGPVELRVTPPLAQSLRWLALHSLVVARKPG